MELYVRFGVTGTGSVDPHARHCRAVDGAQSLVNGICPTQPRALGRWICAAVSYGSVLLGANAKKKQLPNFFC